jgi:hypothetical protein
MGDVQTVTLYEDLLFDDLSRSTFTDEDAERILDDIDKLEEDIVTWGRPLDKCFDILSDTGNVTVYRRRKGDLRSFFVRVDNTLLCIGAGKRDTVYERDGDTIQRRAEHVAGSE